MGCKGTERQDYIVGTVNKRMVELADNTSQNLWWGTYLVEEDIEL